MTCVTANFGTRIKRTGGDNYYKGLSNGAFVDDDGDDDALVDEDGDDNEDDDDNDNDGDAGRVDDS